MKALHKKLAVFLPLWIVAIGLVAWAIRGAYLRSHPRIPPSFAVCVPDPLLGQALKPGFIGDHVTEPFECHVVVNALGWRGPETTRAKPVGTFRVALLGDSFVFGWGVEVEASFTGWLREWWKDRTPPVEVLAFGVPGWSPDHLLVLLRNGLFDFAPDLVVVQLCVNDLADLAIDVLELDPSNLPVAVKTRSKLTADEMKEAIAELKRDYGIELADLQKKMTEQQIHDFVRKQLAKAASRTRSAVGVAPTGAIESLSHEEITRGLATGPEFQARYLVYLLSAIAAECASRSVPVRFLWIDDGSCDASARAALVPLREWLAQRGDAYLDADSFLPFTASDDFFEGDPHWTTDGHYKAALAIRAWLEPALPK